MKNTASIIAASAFLGLSIATTPVAFAQPPVQVVTETTTTGTVSEFGPERIVVRTTTSKTPLGYTFTKTTTYVDENGAPVSVETMKSGLPVTIYYSKDGDRMIATKVVVRKMATRDGTTVVEERTTAGTQTMGTISEFGRDAFEISSETAKPVRYLYSTKTTYVDEDGNPVSLETVKSGLPVTVYYTHEGDRMNATKVIVRKAAPPEIIIRKKTTVTEEKK